MVEPELIQEAPAPSRHERHDSMPSPMVQGLQESVNETASRLAVLEERAGNLRKKSQVTEQSLLEYERETRVDVKALGQRLTELARKVEEVHEKIGAMAGELGTTVKRHELKVLERYMDLWQPLSFVTREEAKILMKDAKK